MLIGTSLGEVIYVALPSFSIRSLIQMVDENTSLPITSAVSGSRYLTYDTAAFVLANPVRDLTT